MNIYLLKFYSTWNILTLENPNVVLIILMLRQVLETDSFIIMLNYMNFIRQYQIKTTCEGYTFDT